MHLLSTLLLTNLALATSTLTGQAQSRKALEAIFSRQFHLCKPVPAPGSCSESCGPGFQTCITFPNCYNPTVGQKCCSDGSYCDADETCTDAGCCPSDIPLSQCGASQTLSVILPEPESTPASTIIEESTSATTSLTTIGDGVPTTTLTFDYSETETFLSTSATTYLTTIGSGVPYTTVSETFVSSTEYTSESVSSSTATVVVDSSSATLAYTVASTGALPGPSSNVSVTAPVVPIATGAGGKLRSGVYEAVIGLVGVLMLA